MKVGIIGLKPHQVADLKGRRLKHTLDFYDRKTFDGEHINSFSRHYEKVIVVSQATPRGTYKLVPEDKRIGITGGVSSVIQALSELPFDVPATPAKPVNSNLTSTLGNGHPTTIVADESAEPAVSEGLEEVEDVSVETTESTGTETAEEESATPAEPSGEPEEEIETIQPDATGRHDYTAVLNGSVGQRFRYAKPAGVGRTEWRGRVQSTRYGYEKKRGVTCRLEFQENFVDFIICEIRPENRRKWTDRISTPAAPPSAPVAPKVVVAYSKGSDNPPEAPATATPPVTDGKSDAFTGHAELPHGAPFTNHTVQQRTLWRQVVVALLERGETLEAAWEKADLTIEAYAHRFQ